MIYTEADLNSLKTLAPHQISLHVIQRFFPDTSRTDVLDLIIDRHLTDDQIETLLSSPLFSHDAIDRRRFERQLIEQQQVQERLLASIDALPDRLAAAITKALKPTTSAATRQPAK